MFLFFLHTCVYCVMGAIRVFTVYKSMHLVVTSIQIHAAVNQKMVMVYSAAEEVPNKKVCNK